MQCPVCSSSQVIDSYELYDDRYGYPKTCKLYRCQRCTHIFQNSTFTQRELSQLYTGCYPSSSTNVVTFHQEKRGVLSWLRGDRADAFRWVPKNCCVLDIGCGHGETLGYHRDRGCEAHGIDPDKNLEAIARRYDLSIIIGMFSAKLYKKNYFDYVTFDQVIEHITDPVAFLKDVKKVLRTDGTIILSTPNFDSWSCRVLGKKSFLWHVPYHLQFFTEHSLRVAAKRAGLEVVHVKYITKSSWFLYQLVHYCTYPKKGQKSEFFDSPRTKKSVRTICIQAFFHILHSTFVTHCIARLLDALRIGDNVVFFLQKPQSARC